MSSIFQQGQRQGKTAPFAHFAFQRDLAVVQVGQLLRNGQAKAGGIVLGVSGGVEVAVKDGGLVFGSDAAAGVLHKDEGAALRSEAVDRDRAAGGGVVDGVGHEVLDDLLQPHGVAPDGQLGVEPGRQRDAFFRGLVLAALTDGRSSLAEGDAVFVEHHLLLLQLGGEEQVLRQPPQKGHPLLHGGQKGGQGVRGSFQRVKPAGHREQRAAQVVEDVQHHALAGFTLLGQGAGALDHPLIQLPRQMLGAVELQCEPAADEGHAAQREGNVVDAGAAHQIKPDTLRKEGKIQPRQDDPRPQPGGYRVGEEQQQNGSGAFGVSKKEQPHAVDHAAEQGRSTHTGVGVERDREIADGQYQHQQLLGSADGGDAGERGAQQDGGQHGQREKTALQCRGHRVKADGGEDDRRAPCDEHREIEQEIPQLPLVLIIIERQHHRREGAEDCDGQPLQCGAQGERSLPLRRVTVGPCGEQDLGVLGRGTRIGQRRQLCIVPDARQRDAHGQHDGPQHYQNLFSCHDRPPEKPQTSQNQLSQNG